MKKTKKVERELSIEKKSAILDGAMREFLVNGYAATSMDKIASTAGVSKATIYSHFQDKANLFTALVEHLACQKSKFTNLQQLQALGDNPAQVLTQFAQEMLHTIEEKPQLLTLFRLMIGESGRFPELARAFVAKIEQPEIQLITDYLASHPQLNLPDPEVAARAFLGGLIHFLILRDLLHGGDIAPMESDRLIDQLLLLILKPHQK